MLNLDTSLITDGVAESSSFLLDIFDTKNNKILSEIFGKSKVKSEGTSLNPKAITPNIIVPTGSLQNQKSTPDIPVDSFIDINNGLNNKNVIDDVLKNSINIDNIMIDLPDAL
jgi:hypothetical protein